MPSEFFKNREMFCFALSFVLCGDDFRHLCVFFFRYIILYTATPPDLTKGQFCEAANHALDRCYQNIGLILIGRFPWENKPYNVWFYIISMSLLQRELEILEGETGRRGRDPGPRSFDNQVSFQMSFDLKAFFK